MYYENLLRVHQQLLYQREQEIKQLKDQLRVVKHSTMVEVHNCHQIININEIWLNNITGIQYIFALLFQVQCQLADTSSDILLEITALRAKITEMRDLSMCQEGIIREKVKEEYAQLVLNMFSSCFDLKKKFDEFRWVAGTCFCKCIVLYIDMALHSSSIHNSEYIPPMPTQ